MGIEPHDRVEMDSPGTEIGKHSWILGGGASRSYSQKGGRLGVAQNLYAVIEQRRETLIDDDLPPVYFRQMLDEVGGAAALLAHQRLKPGEQYGIGQMF